MLLTGAAGYGTLRAEVADKADNERVAVVETQVKAIREDLRDIKDTQKEILNELRRSR
jgi:hypothetical protein